MSLIPSEKAFDSTVPFLREGYGFTLPRYRRFGTDAFRTRIMLTPAVVVRGEEAARVFYEPGRFTRRTALPRTALLSLQDRGSVATLDTDEHAHRKRMFASLLTGEGPREVADAFEQEWRLAAPRWAGRRQIVFFEEMRSLLCRAGCSWAGIELSEAEAAERTHEFGAMIEGAGAVGPRNWRGLWLRGRTERWARGIIRAIRRGERKVPANSAVSVIASHRNRAGRLLTVSTAAVELLNVLRPTVAVDRFITFAALALHRHPEARSLVESGGEAELEAFAQEVRRFYPFFPAVGGKVLESFSWRDHRFENGDWVLLDLYGTDHDPRIWGDPENFRPERFLGWTDSGYALIPQGGGDLVLNHRCPGEAITLELIKRAVRLLVSELDYEIPPQDLRIDLGRMPAIPESRLVMKVAQASS